MERGSGPPIKSTGVSGMATDVQGQRTITVGESMAGLQFYKCGLNGFTTYQ